VVEIAQKKSMMEREESIGRLRAKKCPDPEMRVGASLGLLSTEKV
jgi:hypothetical protein